MCCFRVIEPWVYPDSEFCSVAFMKSRDHKDRGVMLSGTDLGAAAVIFSTADDFLSLSLSLQQCRCCSWVMQMHKTFQIRIGSIHKNFLPGCHANGFHAEDQTGNYSILLRNRGFRSDKYSIHPIYFFPGRPYYYL